MPSASAPAPSDRFRLRQLFTLGPGSEDHYVGLRAGLGVLLPLLALIALQRIDLAPYAVFGAFTGVYSRVPGHLDRMVVQIKAAGLMWVVILAAFLAGRHLVHGGDTTAGGWWLIGLTTLVAAVCSVAVGFLRIRPAGSLFHIFAFAAIASIPAGPTLGDAMFTATATMILSVVLGQLGRVWPMRRTPWYVRPVPPFSPELQRKIWAEGLAYLVAAGLSGTAALCLSGPLGMGHTYWAMVAAVVPLAGHSTTHRMIRAVHRVLGTAVGLLVMLLIVVVQPPAWGAVLFIGAAQFITECLVARNYFWATVFITPMALVGTALGRELNMSVLYDRAVETVIGLVIGVLMVVAMNAIGARFRRRGEVADPADEGGRATQ